jgi:hypothetical protein
MKLAVLTLLPPLACFAPASTKSNSPQPLLNIADVSTSYDDEKLPTASDLRTVTGRCDWGHEDLIKSPYWGIELNPADLQEIKDALEVCKAPGSGLDLQDGWQPLGVTPENFPLKRLAKKLKEMADELEDGTGAVMIKNMPVENYSVEDLGIIYAGVNSYIGNWVPQSSAGLRSKSRGFGLPLGRVEAEMVGNTPKNGLQANNYFRLHPDRCDVITLMCIRPAPAGGASRVCSSVRLHNTMVTEYPALCARLYQPFYRIWEGAKGYFDLPVWSITKASSRLKSLLPTLRMLKFSPTSLGSTKKGVKRLIFLKKSDSVNPLSLPWHRAMFTGSTTTLSTTAVTRGASTEAPRRPRKEATVGA